MQQSGHEIIYPLNGNDFACSISSRDGSGAPKNGRIIRRCGRRHALVFDHPGPWPNDGAAFESMRIKALSVAFQAPPSITGCSE